MAVGDSAVSLAAVNGTILAIAIAAVSAYLLMVFQAADQMVTRMVRDANQIDDVRLDWFLQLSYQAEGRDIDELLTIFERVTSGGPDGRWQLPPRDDKVGRGRVLLTVLSAIAITYPFDSGPLRDLDTRAGVIAWLGDLEPRLRRLVATMRSRERVRDLVAAAEAREAADEANRLAGEAERLRAAGVDPARFLRPLTTSNYREFLARFSAWLTHQTGVVQRVQEGERELARYRRRRVPSHRQAVAGTLVVVVVFVSGVALPMLWSKVPRLFSAWVPVGIYSACLLAAAHLVGKRYPGLDKSQGGDAGF